jgi:diacylglycerol kinase (ATP)
VETQREVVRAAFALRADAKALEGRRYFPFPLMMPRTPLAPEEGVNTQPEVRPPSETPSGGTANGAEPGGVSDKKVTALGAKRVINAFFYSMEGLGSTWKHEEAFRQEMMLAWVLIPLALVLPVDYYGKALMIGSVLLVLIVELLNSGLEWCVDLAAQQQRHPFAKRAKDMGSAAVFLSLVNCLLMWCMALGQAVLEGKLGW